MRVWFDGVFYRIPAAVSRGDLLVTDRGVLRCVEILHTITGALAVVAVASPDMWWSEMPSPEPIRLEPLE